MAKKKMTLEEKLEEAIVKNVPYEVPENWVWSKLGVITEIKTGRKDANHGTEDGDYPFYTCASEPIKSPTYSFDGEYIILPGNGANVGMALYHKGKFEAYQRTYALNSEMINTKYMLYNLRFRWKKYNENKQYGSATNYIKLGNITEYEIAIAPLKEQQRIVDKIESLFEKLDKAKELIEEARDNFEKRKSAILEKAFRGELTKVWREDNNIKYEFVDDLLGNIIEEGPQNGLYKPQSAYGEGNIIVRIDNFYNGKINPWNTLKKLKLTEDDISKYSLENGDIILNRVNSIEYLGKSALVRELNETCVFESNIMRAKLNKNVNNEYVVYYLNSTRGLYELRKTAKHAVNQASINQQDVKKAIVPLTSLEEQNEIVKILDKILAEESKIEELTQLEEQIELIKKSILAKAFRGQLGTNCEDDENAIELLKEILNKE